MLCGLGAIFSWLLLARVQVGRRLDDIRERGEPATLAELSGHIKVPEDQVDSSDAWNAAVNTIDLHMIEPAGPLPFVGTGAAPAGIDYEWESLNAARDFLNQHSAQIEAVHSAAASGNHAAFPRRFSETDDPQHLKKLRWMTRVLQLDAHVAVLSGDRDRLLTAIKTQVAIVNALRYEADMIGQLTRFGLLATARATKETLLPHANPSDADLAELQTQLLDSNIKSGLHRTLIGERLLVLEQIEEAPWPIHGPLGVCCLDYYDEWIGLLEHDWPTLIPEHTRLSAAPTTTRLFTFPLASADVWLTRSAARTEALRRCEIVSLALWRHQLKYGTTPQKLDQIADEFLTDIAGKRVLTDPFDGKQLRFRVTNGGWMVYSIGHDLVDNGGDLDTHYTSRRHGEGGDCGFELAVPVP